MNNMLTLSNQEIRYGAITEITVYSIAGITFGRIDGRPTGRNHSASPRQQAERAENTQP